MNPKLSSRARPRALGNITSITRKGMIKGASNYTNTTIDNQTLTIPAGANLTTQSDGTSSIPQSHINLEAPHNHLNLPTKFDFGTGNTIELLYDGLGNKLRKTVKTAGATTLTQDYLDGIELKNNTVEAVYNEEGRAFNNGGTFRYEFALRDHLGNTRLVFTDKNGSGSIDHTEILSETHYYPFGKTFDGAWYSDASASKYRYLYNGKELSEEFDLNFYDYGARWLDVGMGSWWEVDPASEKYFGDSPYNYVHNNPVNAKDPDGRLVVFVNGQKNTAQALRDYWEGFDSAVMKRLNDNNAQYYDGSLGGWANTVGGSIFTGMGNNLSASNRYKAGNEKGFGDAAGLIAGLARDKNGNITETIKIITHSMGGVYGSGFLAGLKKYLKNNPELEKQVKISLVAHFDPFQGSDITTDPNVFTMQFMHQFGLTADGGKRNESDSFWWLANEKVNGTDYFEQSSTEMGHGIGSFFENIGTLQEGSYIWNSAAWECQNCK